MIPRSLRQHDKRYRLKESHQISPIKARAVDQLIELFDELGTLATPCLFFIRTNSAARFLHTNFLYHSF